MKVSPATAAAENTPAPTALPVDNANGTSPADATANTDGAAATTSPADGTTADGNAAAADGAVAPQEPPRPHKRRCRMCLRTGPDEDMVQFRTKRFRLLSEWCHLKSAKQFAHHKCLAPIGLHPFPYGVELDEHVNKVIEQRIEATAIQCAYVRDPYRLGRIVLEQLRKQIVMPYGNFDRIKEMLKVWITKHWVNGRLTINGRVIDAADNDVLEVEAGDRTATWNPPDSNWNAWMRQPAAASSSSSSSSSASAR